MIEAAVIIFLLLWTALTVVMWVRRAWRRMRADIDRGRLGW